MVVHVPSAKVALSTASTYPESTAAAFEIAARLAGNKREQELLKRRIAEAADAESRSLISE